MKNADQPIAPCIMQKVGEHDYRLSKPNDPKEWHTPVHGLTKREYFAAQAMQAFATNPDWAKTMDEISEWNDYSERLATIAVSLADALLAELSKTEKP